MEGGPDGSVFDSIATLDDVDKQDADQVRAFFRGDAQGAENLLRAYVTLAKGSYSYSDSAWDKIERKLIFDRKEDAQETSAVHLTR